MPRPKKKRMVHEPPLFNDFKPKGFPGKFLDKVTLSLDEYEALRLADFLKLSHEEAASQMEISRPVFTRLIDQAREKLVKMIVEGKMISIEGGDIHFKNNLIKCLHCGQISRVKIGDSYSGCPGCKSSELVNFAKDFGHGPCCDQFKAEKMKVKINLFK